MRRQVIDCDICGQQIVGTPACVKLAGPEDTELGGRTLDICRDGRDNCWRALQGALERLRRERTEAVQ